MTRILGLKEEAQYGVASDTVPDWHQEIEKGKAGLGSEPMTYSGGSRMIKKTKAGALNPEASYDMKPDLKRIGHYIKAFLGNYVFTGGGSGPNTHEFYGSEKRILPSFTGWSTFDYFTKQLLGLVCESLKLEVSDELMGGSAEWKYKTETKINSVPLPSDQKMIPNDLLIAFYDTRLEIEGDAPPGIVTNLSFDGKNNLNVDKTRGLGHRGPQRKPKAQAREIGLEFESTLEPETLALIEKAEYGEVGNNPSECKVYKLPLKIIVDFCEDTDDQLILFFPECNVSVEYEASAADEIDCKFSLQALGTQRVTLEDGVTDVVTDMYVKLLNNQPEITSGVIGTSTVSVSVHDCGDPVVGAIVTLTNRATGAEIVSAATGAQGGCTLSTVPMGFYDITVVNSTSEVLEVTPEIVSINESTETLAITRNTSAVSITLHDGVTPVVGAIVTLTNTVTSAEFSTGATSAGGAASVDHVPYGTYDVTVVDSLSDPVLVTPVTLVVDVATETLVLLVEEGE